MIVESGTIVFLSLIVLYWRMPVKARIWFIKNPAWLEVPLMIMAYALHYGTFSGMMAAAVAGLTCYGYMQLMGWAYKTWPDLPMFKENKK